MLQLDDDKGDIIYKRDLEPLLLKESEEYYKAEGEKLLESCDTPEYLLRVCSAYYCYGPNYMCAGRRPVHL
jgi:hypothetical protein